MTFHCLGLDVARPSDPPAIVQNYSSELCRLHSPEAQ